MSKTHGEVEINTSSRNEELERIEEEHEQSGSSKPSMEESEHQCNSNKNGSEDDTKEDSISTVSLGWGFRV